MKRFLVLLVLAACHAQEPWRTLDWQPEAQHGSTELLAGIRRRPCFGRCPSYTVALYRDGFVEYVGEDAVRIRGRATKRVPVERVRALEAQFVAANFVTFDNYDEETISDAPWAYTWYRPAGGPTKWVKHYFGDGRAPAALKTLEDAVDAAVGITEWTR